MGDILVVKVKNKGGRTGSEYNNKINPHDVNLLLLILYDLETQFGFPVRKACEKFLGKEQKNFPFINSSLK